MGLSITIASGKGGSGKTLIAANLGVALAEFGKDVIILDGNLEMPNLELLFGMEGTKRTLRHVLRGDANIEDAIYRGPKGVKLISGGISLQVAEPELVGIEDVVEHLLKKTEILIIDAPPGIGKDAVAALAAGQELLLVLTPELPSIPCALKTKEIAKGLGIHLLGLVLNRAEYHETDIPVKDIEKTLRSKVLAVIPEDPEARISSAYGQPVVIRKPDSPASVALKKLAADLIGEKYALPNSSFIKRFMRR